MKLTINHRTFADAVTFVARLSPKRPTQPILTGVLLQAESGTLTATVYDYETAAQTTADAEISVPGEVLVHASYLAQIAAKLPAKDVQLEATDRELTIRCGAVRASLPLMEAEIYPRPDFTGDTVTEVAGAVFEDAVMRVAPAASKNPATPIIMGVRITGTADGLVLCATDRYRVAHMHLPCAVEPEVSLVIMAGVLVEAAKALGSSEIVRLIVTENGSLVLRGDRGTLMARHLADGRFAPVERLFPTEPKSVARLTRDIVVEATSRAALATDVEGAARYSFEVGECSISGISKETANGITEAIEVDYEGDPLTVSLKPQYVLDAMSACRAPQLDLWFTHDANASMPSSVMFTAGDGFRYLVQPNLLLK